MDERIAHLREVARRLTDPQTLTAIEILITELEAKKVARHPERKE